MLIGIHPMKHLLERKKVWIGEVCVVEEIAFALIVFHFCGLGVGGWREGGRDGRERERRVGVVGRTKGGEGETKGEEDVNPNGHDSSMKETRQEERERHKSGGGDEKFGVDEERTVAEVGSDDCTDDDRPGGRLLYFIIIFFSFENFKVLESVALVGETDDEMRVKRGKREEKREEKKRERKVLRPRRTGPLRMVETHCTDFCWL